MKGLTIGRSSDDTTCQKKSNNKKNRSFFPPTAKKSAGSHGFPSLNHPKKETRRSREWCRLVLVLVSCSHTPLCYWNYARLVSTCNISGWNEKTNMRCWWRVFWYLSNLPFVRPTHAWPVANKHRERAIRYHREVLRMSRSGRNEMKFTVIWRHFDNSCLMWTKPYF